MADAKVTVTISPNRLKRNIKKAQIYLDNAVLNKSEPYTPLVTGQLIQSSIENTKAGGGAVIWKTPYARKVYYRPGPIGRVTGPLRGFRWFDRMMADHGKEIIKETKRIAGED